MQLFPRCANQSQYLMPSNLMQPGHYDVGVFCLLVIKPWARHGSTIYLWKERDVEKAVEYVLLGQGDPPVFD